MSLKFNISKPVVASQITSLDDSFKPDNIKKQNKKSYKYRTRNGELWRSAKDWLPFYRCQACHILMSRKKATTFPQRINTCGHITCAKCIVNSYIVDLNPLCPVKECDKCVNPRYKKTITPLTILIEDTPSNVVFESPTTTYVSDAIATQDYNSKLCYCYNNDCEWDCGTLWCGCIDICRGRCGFNRDIFSRW